MIACQKQYSHVIWDWNGTLIDDVWLCLDILNKILCLHNKPTVTRNQYISLFKHPVKSYYEDLGFDFSKVSFADIALFYNNEYDAARHQCNLHRDVESIVSMLFSAGIKQYVLSAYQQHRLEESAKHFGIDMHFEEIAGLEDCYAHSKLDRGRDLICDSGIDPSKTVIIGDTLHDYDVASELGIDCILIANGHNSRQRLKSCGMPVMNSMSELIETLMTMVTN